MVYHKQIAENIKKFRELKNLTRDQMAADLDMSLSGYGKLERGEVDISISKLKIFAYYFKGLFMNLLNPGMLFYWIGLVSYLSTSATYSQDEIKIFLITCMGTVLSTDIIKAYFAAKMRHLFNPKVIHLMNLFFFVSQPFVDNINN